MRLDNPEEVEQLVERIVGHPFIDISDAEITEIVGEPPTVYRSGDRTWSIHPVVWGSCITRWGRDGSLGVVGD